MIRTLNKAALLEGTRRRLLLGLIILPCLLVLLVSTAAANAAAPGPGFTLDSVAAPTHFSRADSVECLAKGISGVQATNDAPRYCDAFQVFATNVGSAAAGGVVTLTDTVPAGLTVRALELDGTAPGLSFYGYEGNVFNREAAAHHCGVAGQVVRCAWEGGVAPDQLLKLVVYVTVNENAAEATKLTNTATVSGGGAVPVSTAAGNQVGAEAAPFGVSGFSFFASGVNGARETQAGAHPYGLNVTFDMNNAFAIDTQGGTNERLAQNVGRVKDIVVDLPLGFIGSTLAAPECPLSLLDAGSPLDRTVGCPADTIIGYLNTEPNGIDASVASPIYNLVPERGHPAEFGYVDLLGGAHVFYTQVVPSAQGYVLQTSANFIPETLLRRISVTFYGDPAAKQAELKQSEQESERVEDARREKGEPNVLEVPPSLAELEGTHVAREDPPVQVPFFTNPTLCEGGSQVATLYVDSWQHPGSFNANGTPNVEGPGSEGWVKSESKAPPVGGCDQLAFTPGLEAQPVANEPGSRLLRADTPSGLEFGLKLAQPETFGTLSSSPLKDVSVKFPEGFTVDPSSADGLGTCSEEQIGWLGPNGLNGEELPNGGLTNFNPEKPGCPEDSKIGSLELETPLIPGKIYGELFLATQNANPFGSTFALYVVVNDPITGVVIKIAGELKLNEQTGQITSVFDENPQLPFSNLKLHFFGGPRAELATPNNCGIYQTNSELEPWSFPDSGPPADPFADFSINEGCPTAFNPNFTGGSTNLQAGAYTTFQASFERQDNEPELSGATINLPPGMLANVSSVTECSEAQLQAEAEDVPGGCPESSKVGTTTAGAGPGPDPLFVGGNVFWTGPYNGHGACTPGLSEPECAPYGLAVVVSANPGPFHFGNVLVRQRLFINKETAAATDVSDAFPTFLHVKGHNIEGGEETNGIPIKLRRVDVEINRPGFTFNSTNCAKEAFKVGGEISSTSGASKTLATPFQVTNCGHLKFEPKFSVSVTGKNSKEGGSGLTAKVTEPNVPEGTDAGIHSVKVELPVQLPSRLSTLQKACTDKQFNEDPANCPEASKIGMAVVSTPILPEPLMGPAIFVSHGGEAFPSLTLVLQGDGVTIDLVGTTFISSKSITSTTFKAVPDTPFSTFQLTLPQGKFSALGTNVPEKDKYNLCTQKLVMPNEFTAQNGAEIKQKTTITITGCKPTIYVTHHSVKKATATIVVSVPTAGKLTATGKGVSKGTGKSSKAQDITVKMTLTKADQTLLTKHHLHNALIKVKLQFTPKKGAKLSTTTTVLVG
jgi:hypothetical protein